MTPAKVTNPSPDDLQTKLADLTWQETENGMEVETPWTDTLKARFHWAEPLFAKLQTNLANLTVADLFEKLNQEHCTLLAETRYQLYR